MGLDRGVDLNGGGVGLIDLGRGCGERPCRIAALAVHGQRSIERELVADVERLAPIGDPHRARRSLGFL